MCDACPKVVLSFETDANLSEVPSDNKKSKGSRLLFNFQWLSCAKEVILKYINSDHLNLCGANLHTNS